MPGVCQPPYYALVKVDTAVGPGYPHVTAVDRDSGRKREVHYSLKGATRTLSDWILWGDLTEAV